MAFINRATTYDKLLSIAMTVVSNASLCLYLFRPYQHNWALIFILFHFGVLTTESCSREVRLCIQCGCVSAKLSLSCICSNNTQAGVSLDGERGRVFRKREIFLSSASSITHSRKEKLFLSLCWWTFVSGHFLCFYFYFFYFYFSGTFI